MQGDTEMKLSNRTQLKLLPMIFIALLAPCWVHAHSLVSIAASPARIVMGAQYDGLNLKVDGTVPAGSDVILRFTGAPDTLHLREKGKIFGMLWMNVGKVTLKNVPKVCLINTSCAFDKMADAATPFRLEALGKALGIEKEGGDDRIDIAHELLLLKKHEGLYGESAQGVTLGPDEGPVRSFSAEVKIPSALAPGDYQVEVIAVHNGTLAGRYATSIQAELVGFPKWLSNLAFHNSLLYGILATVIAILSGLAIGLVFQGKGAH